MRGDRAEGEGEEVRRSFTCAECGGTFEANPDWSEADRLVEYQETFTEEQRARDREQPVVVCDDCYRAMVARMPPQEY